MVTFVICQLLATPEPFEYFCQNRVPSENQSFLDEGVTSSQQGLGLLGGQMGYMMVPFWGGGGVTHLRGCQGPLEKKLHFSAHL